MRRRKLKRKKQKKILIIGSLSLLLFLCAGYAAFNTSLSITAKGNIKEKTRVIQSWDMNSQTDFHSDFYKENIVSVTFLDNNNIPDNTTESWNVSEDKENGGVMAWVVPNSNDNTKYDLYVGARGGVIANSDSSYLFYLCTGIEVIDFNNNYDTRYVTDMNHMFSGAWIEDGDVTLSMSLKEIKGLENFDTSNVISMSRMFLFCTDLTSLNVSSFNTSNVTDMSLMFNQLKSLKSIDLSNFDTSNVTNMARMFRDSGFVTLNLSNFNTSNVTNMETMFFGNINLESLDVSNFDTSNVTNMYAMFASNSKLKNLNLCSFNTYKVEDMAYMFAETYSLEHIYVGPNWNTSQADTSIMFSNSNIKSVTKDQC